MLLSFCRSLFLLIILPSPRSILFPYTTLFRSLALKDIDAVLISTGDFQHAPLLKLAVEAGKDAYCEDRKSTRLNSSHRCISYAVFCLKKKKKEITKVQVA